MHGATAAQVSTAAQAGYMLGIVFLVPLGDIHARPSVILGLTLLLILSLLAAAMGPNLACLIAATLAQQAVPLAAGLADPASARRAVGHVLSGLLAGIFLGQQAAAQASGTTPAALMTELLFRPLEMGRSGPVLATLMEDSNRAA